MNLESHVKNVRCSCFQHIKWISDIGKYITDDAAKQLVHAFVTCRLDNGNSLLYGLLSSVIHKLQMVQHAAARVITRTRKFYSITPVLKKLHYLPVHKIIIFKLLALAYRSIRGTVPQYLSSLLRSHQLSRNLRSASQALLTVDRTRVDTYGSRAFSVVRPVLWNELPHDIKCAETLSSFKSQLKKTSLLPSF